MKKSISARILFAVFDIIYSVTVIAMFSFFVYWRNYGIFRLFLFTGTVAGFALYHGTVGRIFIFFSEAIVNFIERLAYVLVIRPVGILLRFLARLAVRPIVLLVKTERRRHKSERYMRRLGETLRFDFEERQ